MSFTVFFWFLANFSTSSFFMSIWWLIGGVVIPTAVLFSNTHGIRRQELLRSLIEMSFWDWLFIVTRKLKTIILLCTFSTRTGNALSYALLKEVIVGWTTCKDWGELWLIIFCVAHIAQRIWLRMREDRDTLKLIGKVLGFDRAWFNHAELRLLLIEDGLITETAIIRWILEGFKHVAITCQVIVCDWVGWVCSWEDLVEIVLGLRIEDRFDFFILD